MKRLATRYFFAPNNYCTKTWKHHYSTVINTQSKHFGGKEESTQERSEASWQLLFLNYSSIDYTLWLWSVLHQRLFLLFICFDLYVNTIDVSLLLRQLTNCVSLHLLVSKHVEYIIHISKPKSLIAGNKSDTYTIFCNCKSTGYVNIWEIGPPKENNTLWSHSGTF